jgi:hypothetical protein
MNTNFQKLKPTAMSLAPPALLTGNNNRAAASSWVSGANGLGVD